MLAAGIDVYSTVNVQHLESLNDQVAELTGTHVRETLPDSVLAAADDVVLIDITPDSLDRAAAARARSIRLERVPGALANFFTPANLTALREISLRQVAEEVEAKRLPSPGAGRAADRGRAADQVLHTAAPRAIGERLLALVLAEPSAQRIVRRAWRSSQRLGAELDVLWVATTEPTSQQSEQLVALRRLCSVLGAHLLVESGDSVAAVVERVVGERGSTYMLMGPPRPRSAWQRLSAPDLTTQLLTRLPGVDLRIVADRAPGPGPWPPGSDQPGAGR